MSAIITLTTDFGLEDSFVGVMKGVILSIAPDVRLVDLCHGVPPQDVVGGALALESAPGFFPEGTVHVGVVDPGVGSDRAPIAIQSKRGFYVGPDNGLFALALARDPMVQAVRLTNAQFHATSVCATFHGRDIFAPVAAHLAVGVPLEELGEAIHNLVDLNLPAPRIDRDTIEATAIHADRFGNLNTNLTAANLNEWLAGRPPESIDVEISGERISGISRTFSDRKVGDTVIYVGSGGRMEVAIREGSALNRFGPTATMRLLLKK